MARPDYTLTVGDLLPAIRETLLDQSGSVVDLSAVSTVQMKIGDASGTDPDRYETATIVGDPTAGVVQYDIVVADTAAPRTWLLRWVVTFVNGRQASFPDDDEPFRLLVSPR